MWWKHVQRGNRSKTTIHFLGVILLALLSSSHQVGGDELVGESLVKRPAVREVRNREPKRNVVRVGVIPAGTGVVDVLHEGGVVVVVDGVAVDVAEHVPHLRHHGAGVEVGAFEIAPLHPEVSIPAEGCVVQLFERVIGGHENIPFHNGKGVVV